VYNLHESCLVAGPEHRANAGGPPQKKQSPLRESTHSDKHNDQYLFFRSYPPSSDLNQTAFFFSSNRHLRYFIFNSLIWRFKKNGQLRITDFRVLAALTDHFLLGSVKGWVLSEIGFTGPFANEQTLSHNLH
jgi:hypothetical protein